MSEQCPVCLAWVPVAGLHKCKAARAPASDEVARIVRERQLSEMTQAQQRAERLAYWQSLSDADLMREWAVVEREADRHRKLAAALDETEKVADEVAQERGLLE